MLRALTANCFVHTNSYRSSHSAGPARRDLTVASLEGRRLATHAEYSLVCTLDVHCWSTTAIRVSEKSRTGPPRYKGGLTADNGVETRLTAVKNRPPYLSPSSVHRPSSSDPARRLDFRCFVSAPKTPAGRVCSAFGWPACEPLRLG